MRISDWSSDVCSSDLARSAPCQCQRRAGALCGGRKAESAEQRPACRAGRTARGDRGCEGFERGRRAAAPEGAETAGDRDRRIAAAAAARRPATGAGKIRPEDHTLELNPLMRTPYAVSSLKKKKRTTQQ